MAESVEEEAKSAMVLTDHEWGALAQICRAYLRATEGRDDFVNVEGRRAIAERIVKACEEW